MYCSSLSYFLLKQDQADVSSTYFPCSLYHCLYSFLLICSKIVAGWYLLSESTGESTATVCSMPFVYNINNTEAFFKRSY